MFYYMGIIWASIIALGIVGGIFDIIPCTKALLFTVAGFGAFTCYLFDFPIYIQTFTYIIAFFAYYTVYLIQLFVNKTAKEGIQKAIVVFILHETNGICIVKTENDLVSGVCIDCFVPKVGQVVYLYATKESPILISSSKKAFENQGMPNAEIA